MAKKGIGRRLPNDPHQKRVKTLWERHFPDRPLKYGIKTIPGVHVTNDGEKFIKAFMDSNPSIIDKPTGAEVEALRERMRADISAGSSLSGMFPMTLRRDNRYPVFINTTNRRWHDYRKMSAEEQLTVDMTAEGAHIIFFHVKNTLHEKANRDYRREFRKNPHEIMGLSEAFDKIECFLRHPLVREGEHYQRVVVPDQNADRHYKKGVTLAGTIIKRFRNNTENEEDIHKAGMILLIKEFRNTGDAQEYFEKVDRTMFENDAQHARRILEGI